MSPWGEMDEDARAEMYFDQHIGPGLQDEGMSPTELFKTRQWFVRSAVMARAELAGYRTKTGRVLSEEEIAELVAEAARGYPLWRCELQFELTSGEFSREAHLHLTKKGISRVTHVESPTRYRYQCKVPGEKAAGAVTHASLNLSTILNPYDVLFEIVETRVVKQA